MSALKFVLTIAAVLLITQSQAAAITFGITGASTTEAAAVVTAQSHTATILPDLSAASLSGVDVLWALNASNSVPLGQLQTFNTEVEAFVNQGGVLLYHDRDVTGAGSVLPGAPGITFTRDLGPDDADIDVATFGTLVTDGPGGIIDDTTLDGGNSSSHGFALSGTLPGPSTEILSRPQADEIVDFHYDFGDGVVYYSSIPLDFYLGGAGIASFRDIYAPNVVAQAAALAIPEPSSLCLLSLIGIGVLGRRRNR